MFKGATEEIKRFINNLGPCEDIREDLTALTCN